MEQNLPSKLGWRRNPIGSTHGAYTILGESYPKNLTDQYAYSGSMIMVKIDSSGNIFWNRTFPNHWAPSSIIQTGDGEIPRDGFNHAVSPSHNHKGGPKWHRAVDPHV